MQFGVPYQGEDVGRQLVTNTQVSFFNSPSDDEESAGYLKPGSTILITAYVDGDPKLTTQPIWLVVKAQGRQYLIKKDDTGEAYSYVENKNNVWLWVLIAAAVLMLKK